MTASNHPNSNFIAERLPNWVKALDASTLKTVGDSLLLEQTTAPGDWFDAAARFDRQALLDRQAQREQCRQALSALIPEFKGVMAFAEQPLRTRIKQTFGQELDVHTTSLLYVSASTSFAGLVSHYTAVEQSLLQAALHNFDDGQAFDSNAGLVAADGYSLEYIPHEQLQLTLPPNPGDFPLDFTGLTPTADPYPLFRYDKGARLPISPAVFAQMCRELDLGRQYQDYLAETFKPDAVGEALQALRKAEFAVLCQVALMQDQIDADDFAMLEGCRLGHPLQHAGRPMQALRLQLLTTELHDVVVFVPTGESAQPCIVWMPGDSQVPLKRYSNSGEFMRELVKRLRQPEYLTEFLGRVHLANRVAFGQLLAQRLMDSSPSLEVTHPAWEPALFEHVHRRHLLWLSSQALHQAVPTSEADKLARIERWQGYLDTGLNALGFAALFIPGLGPVLLPIMGAQMMNGLYHGLADLAEGDKAAAWNHLGGLALNLGLMAVFHQGMQLTTEISPFTDNLLPVEGPDGVARLWNGDIRPYAAELAIDPAWRPNALGLYEVEGVEYLPLDGQLYRTRIDELTGQRVITRPAQPDAYEPGLRGGADSGWLHAGDRPAQWEAQALLRRLEPRAVALDDARLEQVLKIADIDEQTLRSAVAEGGTVPFELLDTLQRAVTAQELDRVLAAVAEGEAVSSLHGVPVEAMVQAPTWPQDIVLKVFEGSEPWGDFSEYGASEYGASELPQARRIAVMREDLAGADRLAPLLKGLGEEGLTTLLGQSTSAAETQTVQLQKLLASELQTQRARLFEQWHATELARLGSTAVASAEEQLVMRQFPRLDQPLARSVVDSASSTERALLEQGRLPLRLAEQAHHLQRNLRLNRALLECTYAPGQSADSQRLLLAALGRQEGWGDSLRIELRSNDALGSLIAAAGPEQAALRRTIMVDAAGFRPGDITPMRSLSEAILAVLPAAERTALGSAASDALTLETALTERALADRQASARALGQTDAQPWFRPPMRNSRGQVGYEASGRFWPRTQGQRLKDLYPRLDAAARDDILKALDEDPRLALTRLETEYRVLDESLTRWTDEPHLLPGSAAAQEQAAAREQISARIRAAWRREQVWTADPSRTGVGLDLSGLQGGRLPLLVADMQHVQWLDLSRMALDAPALTDFLPAFREIAHLNLTGNRLVEVPEAVRQMTRLITINLSENLLQWRRDLFWPLAGSQVRTLMLGSNPQLLISGECIVALRELPNLQVLEARESALTLTAADIEHLGDLQLQQLDLHGNQIQLSADAAAAFANLGELTHLRLSNNPLSRAPAVGQLRHLMFLELSYGQFSEWPPGLSALMQQQPLRLMQVGLVGDPIVDVPRLAGTAFANAPRAGRVPLLIDDVALSAQSLQHLREIRIEPFLANAPDWMADAGPELNLRYRRLRDEAGSANFLEAMRRATLSADYQANPAHQRQQMQQLLVGLTQEPQPIGLADLRSQLYEAADGAQGTCGDGLELLFGQARNLMEAFRIATEAGLGNELGLLPVVAYSRRLYRLELVDEYARAITNARVRRRHVIYPDAATADAAGTLPVLTTDPSLLAAADALQANDRITDLELQVPPDEAEVRLRLRMLLAESLQLPHQPRYMLYASTGFVDEEMAEEIEALIHQQVTAPSMLDWLVLQPYWQSALQRVYPLEMQAFNQRWDAGGVAVYELSRAEPESVVLDAEVLATFRGQLPELDWGPGDLSQRVQLTSADADVLYGALRHARPQALQAVYRRLSAPFVQALLPGE